MTHALPSALASPLLTGNAVRSPPGKVWYSCAPARRVNASSPTGAPVVVARDRDLERVIARRVGDGDVARSCRHLVEREDVRALDARGRGGVEHVAFEDDLREALLAARDDLRARQVTVTGISYSFFGSHSPPSAMCRMHTPVPSPLSSQVPPSRQYLFRLAVAGAACRDLTDVLIVERGAHQRVRAVVLVDVAPVACLLG